MVDAAIWWSWINFLIIVMITENFFCYRAIQVGPCLAVMTANITSQVSFHGDRKTANRRDTRVYSLAWRHTSIGSTSTSRVVNATTCWRKQNWTQVWRIPGRLREHCIFLSNQTNPIYLLLKRTVILLVVDSLSVNVLNRNPRHCY